MTMMKTSRWLTLALLPGFLAGCQSMSNTDQGVLGGGVLGAAIGALAGGPRHAGAGALIGGTAGAVTGGLIGHSEDQREKAHAAAVAATMAGPQQLQEIAQMATNHISDGVIISKIRTSGMVYHLSGDDITYLKTYGVSDAVIVELNATAARWPRHVYAPAPVIYEAPPPPPVGVGIEIGGRIR
jgi:hypothetical protein